MRYVKSTNTYKASNFEMNMTELKAYSYGWWLFVTKHNGKVIFNHTTYSSSTCKHQSKALKLLDYNYDLKLRFTRKSLSDLDQAFNDEIKGAQSEVETLKALIAKKGTRKSTNSERANKIIELQQHIELIQSEYLNV